MRLESATRACRLRLSADENREHRTPDSCVHRMTIHHLPSHAFEVLRASVWLVSSLKFIDCVPSMCDKVLPIGSKSIRCYDCYYGVRGTTCNIQWKLNGEAARHHERRIVIVRYGRLLNRADHVREEGEGAGSTRSCKAFSRLEIDRETE